VPHSLFDLTGRVALVSGAAQGIGRSMSLAFAEAGAEVMLADINETGAPPSAAGGLAAIPGVDSAEEHGQ